MYPRPEANAQVLWIPLDWASSVDLIVTPTTIATYKGNVVWVREGEIDAKGFASLGARLARMPSD